MAPDVLGFGYTARPEGVRYGMQVWTDHLLGFLDALGLDRVSLVGNSFGGALALSMATRAPERVDKLVLMGSVGVPFEITPGLDAVWGFEPSLDAMRDLMGVFAHDRSLLTDDLARSRLEAATRPGVQEAFASMFPAPRQRSVDAMTVDEDLIRAITVPTLVVHGRDDQVIPLSNSLRLLELIDRSQLHVFGQCGHWVQIEHAADSRGSSATSWPTGPARVSDAGPRPSAPGRRRSGTAGRTAGPSRRRARRRPPPGRR